MKLQTAVPLATLTTLRVGGPADFLVAAENVEEAGEAFAFARARKLPVRLLGGGSNVLPADSGFRGLVLQFKTNYIRFGEDLEKQLQKQLPEDARAELHAKVRVAAGTPLAVLVARAAAAGRAGLAELAGLPGTVGGAVAGNAGCYGRTIGELVEEGYLWWPEGRGEVVPANWFDFGYRTSRLKNTDALLIAVSLRLPAGDQTALKKRGLEIAQLRASKQPRGATAGSFFRNPLAAELAAGHAAALQKLADTHATTVADLKAWQLTDGCGLRGAAVGGAAVSAEHANYFVNTGGATAADFVALARQVQTAVATKYAVVLQPEVQIWSETGLLAL